MARKWNSVGAFTGSTTWGSVAKAKTDNFKSALWSSHKGNDLMVQTAEYSFGFNKLLGSTALAADISKNWTSTCTNTWVRSGADFATNLSAAQQKTLSFNIRPHDVNNGCFPGFAETVVIGLVAADCCWIGGLGNSPYPNSSWQWNKHDMSLLLKKYLIPKACTKGKYPCNANGYVVPCSSFSYSTSNKPKYALVFIR